MKPDYTCAVCGDDLEVRPNPMRTNAFTVQPCPSCVSCDDCEVMCDGCQDDQGGLTPC